MFETKMASASEGTGGASGDSNMFTDDSQRPLEEFLHTHTLPQSVSVAGGSFVSRDVMIARGDVLLLRTKAPTSITLSFADDKDSGTTQELGVNPDIPVKFLALPPKDSVQPDASDGSVRVGRGGRPTSMVTYPTVADLLLDCPTYFEANSTYDDPYLPGFSVKPGDRFHFVKVVRDVAGDKMERLQCRTESEELVCLSISCKGNFTVLKDDTPYTLRQLTDLAKVPRRLRLASQNDTDSLVMQEAENVQENAEAKIVEKLRSSTGVITMSRPQEMLEVSPWDNPETTWCIPVDSSLHVRLFSDTDYEEPVLSRPMEPEPMSVFVQQHEYQLPVQATILSYTKSPDTIAQNLSSSREIIVHEKLHSQKLFVKDSKKDEFFAIDESVRISFVQIPRTLLSVFEMMSLPLGSQVQVLADVAADFPEPFILRYGDVLCVTKHDSSSWKFKHSSTGDVPIVKCERLVQGRKAEKLKLPLDLELNLVLIQDPSELRVTKLSDIFADKDEIPSGNVSVLEGNGASYPPLPNSLQILEVLTDNELLVSPLSSTTAISPLINTCVRIPVRHKAVLGLKRKLEFPEGYFVLPSKHDTICLGIERVEESDYEELVQARKVATDYEDVVVGPPRETEEDARSQASSTGRSRHAVNQESIPRSSSSGTQERRRGKDRIKRFSQAINPKNWHRSRPKEPPSGGESAESPAPVSGILTLSLEPSQSVDNDYTEDAAAPGTAAARGPHAAWQGSEPEGPPDDTYEDVEVTYSPYGVASRAADAEHRLHPAADAEHRLHPAADAACSDNTTQVERESHRGQEVSENNGYGKRRRRRKSDPGLAKMSAQADRPSGHRRTSPERHRDRDPSVDELEKAPRTHHARTKSSGLPESRGGKMSSPKDGHGPESSDGAGETHSSRLKVSFSVNKHRSHSSDRARETRPSKHSSAEALPKGGSQDESRTAERLQSHHPRKYKSREFEKSTRPRSPDPDQRRRARSPDLDKHRIHRSYDTNQPRKPSSPDLDKARNTRPPNDDRSRKHRSPDSDHPTTDSGLKHAAQAPQSEKPRPRHRRRRTSPDLGVPGSLENLPSSDEHSERREEERTTKSKKSPPRDTLVAQPRTTSGKPQSPGTERRRLQSELPSEKAPSPRAERRCLQSKLPSEKTLSPRAERRRLQFKLPSEKAPSPRAERRLQQVQTSSGNPVSPSAEDGVYSSVSLATSGKPESLSAGQEIYSSISQATSGQTESARAEVHPQRPCRPHRKVDGSDDRLNRSVDSAWGGDDRLNRSVDSAGGGDDSSTPKTVPKRVKPAVPPKPVLSPRSEACSEVPDTCEPLRNPQRPVAPPRRRGARIRSTELEAFGGGSPAPSNPVVGRKRLS